MESDDLASAVAKAERAVQKVSNEALKVAAFQTVLQELLQRGRRNEVTHTTQTKKAVFRPRSAAPASTGTTGRLLSLVEDGVFGEQRSLSEIKQILAERGWHYGLEDLGTPVTRLVQRKRLRRVRVTEGGKKIWRYSNY
jgi:hypothetical protein